MIILCIFQFRFLLTAMSKINSVKLSIKEEIPPSPILFKDTPNLNDNNKNKYYKYIGPPIEEAIEKDRFRLNDCSPLYSGGYTNLLYFQWNEFKFNHNPFLGRVPHEGISRLIEEVRNKR